MHFFALERYVLLLLFKRTCSHRAYKHKTKNKACLLLTSFYVSQVGSENNFCSEEKELSFKAFRKAEFKKLKVLISFTLSCFHNG